MSEGVKLDAGLVARAGGGVVARIAGGVVLGLVIGVVAFLLQKLTGRLDRGGAWTWALLAVYPIAGAVALGFVGMIKGRRSAARTLLIESGLVAHLTRKALATSADAVARAEAGEPAGSGLVRWAKQLGLKLIAGAIAVVGQHGEPVERVTERVDDAIGGWGRTGAIVAGIALVVVLAAVPVYLAVAS